MRVKKNIKFRKIHKSDLSIIMDWRNSYESREFSNQFTLLNMKNQQCWFKDISKKKSTRKMFMIIYNNKAIGICGLINIDKDNKSADVAILLGIKKWRSKNLGSESLRLLLNYGFKKLQLHRIGAEVFEYNHISVKLFKKLNFNLDAMLKERLWRNGKWWSVYLYSILENEL